MLQCSDMESMAGHEGMKLKAKRMDGMDMAFTTSPSCYATDDMFLQSLAFCIHSRCTDVPVSKLQYFWETYVVGRMPGQPVPKISYPEALLQVKSPPKIIADSASVLNTTTLTNDETFLSGYNGNFYFEEMEVKHNTYGFVNDYLDM
jgi:hypothetical protein